MDNGQRGQWMQSVFLLLISSLVTVSAPIRASADTDFIVSFFDRPEPKPKLTNQTYFDRSQNEMGAEESDSDRRRRERELRREKERAERNARREREREEQRRRDEERRRAREEKRRQDEAEDNERIEKMFEEARSENTKENTKERTKENQTRKRTETRPEPRARGAERGEERAHSEPARSPKRSQVNWAQPPVACVEEIVPRPPSRNCMDLTQVADPRTDWPTGLSQEEMTYWANNKRGESLCRSREILRREYITPGTFPAGAVQLAWMRVKASAKSDLKVSAVYEASRRNQVPVQILAGALTQESLFSELGMAEDGGNYSCGIGQVNLSEWCHWANMQSAEKMAQMGWPAGGVSCGYLSPGLIKPFYEIAKTRLNGLPEYRLDKPHFQSITYRDVVSGFPSGPSSIQMLRYQSAVSFLNNCTDVANGIAAKANELKNLYNNTVPAGLKTRDLYPAGKEYARVCKDKGYTRAYPLSLGWLLAVGIYNAGGRAVDALAHYNNWSADDMAKPETWRGVGPTELVEAFYWTGKYERRDDKIHFNDLSGNDLAWIWFKPCVLQRHIARVVQHVTLPGTPKLVDTLEGEFKCAKSQFDPASGELVKSAVPPHRQSSSGTKRQKRGWNDWAND